MTTHAQEILTRHSGAIRSGLWITADHKRRPIPDGFRYYSPREIPQITNEAARSKAEAIMKRNPRTRWIIAPR